tara:strand:- start:7685 stop:9196 length:1512 start_codon:yes stop_codon:yes gene_type:complete
MNLFEGGIKLTRAEVGKNKTKIIKIGGDVYPYKDILKKYGAYWNKFNKFWFFWANKESEESIIEKRIKPAIAEIKKTHETFIQEIDDIINAIKDGGEAPPQDEIKISPEKKANIEEKLEEFKKMLVNIEDDEDFKNIMKQIITIKSAQGQTFTLGNSLLIFLQNKNAGIVNSMSNWFKFYERKVKNKNNPLLIYAPTKGTKIKKSKEDKEKIVNKYYKKINKKPGDKLTPNEGIELKELKRDLILGIDYDLVPVYSEHDTVQMPGTEDFVKKAKDAQKDVKWFEENAISDEVRPVYTGLIDFAEGEGIEVGLVDDLGGARGVSKSGKIEILKNEGNDVGLTKTLAHEIIHELLHQKYLKNKGGKSGKFNIGRGLSTGAIEQQAELSAWIFMHAFGFDVKTTSLNYTVMWGGDKDNMIKVFQTVSTAVNYLIDQVSKKIKANKELKEGNGGSISNPSKTSPEEIAKLLGVSSEFNKLKNNSKQSSEEDIQELQERIVRKLMKRI